MKLSGVVVAAVLGGVAAVPSERHSAYKSDELMTASFKSLKAYTDKNGYPNAQKCTLKNASVRKEWYVLLSKFLSPV
jgi:hypothetical protein